jgi:hypothetical protein
MSEEWQKPTWQPHGFVQISAQAVTKGSNMVSTSTWVITKGLNTEQKCSRPTTLYTDNENSKEASKP